MARVQSEYFGRWEKGLRRSIQLRRSLEIEVRLAGWVIDSSGLRVGGWDVGDAKALRRKFPDSERRRI